MHVPSVASTLRSCIIAAAVVLLPTLPASLAGQDLTLEYQTRMEFGGMMGQVLSMMPGMGDLSAPSRTITRVSGLRLRTDDGDDSSLIVDAENRRFVQVDHEERTYIVMTPETMREMGEEARARMEAAMDSIQAAQPEAPARSAGDPQVTVEARVETERTGRRESVAGLDAEEWYLTVTADFDVQEEGGNPMFMGSTVAFSDLWMSAGVPGGEEQQRVWQAFGEEMMEAFDLEEGLAPVFAVNPQLQVMIEQNQQAMEEMEGTAVRTITLMVLVPPGASFDRDRAVADLTGELGRSMGAVAGAAAGEAARGAAASAARGALGRLGGGMLGRRNREEPPPPAEEAPAAPSQTTLLRSVEELVRVDRSPIDASVFEIPEGYREITMADLMRGEVR
jgi:hypothetical protein